MKIPRIPLSVFVMIIKVDKMKIKVFQCLYFSWSANIVGRKKWMFLLPGEEDKLRDPLGNLVFDLESAEAAELAETREVVKIEVIQEAGEVVFVPSGWFHQVHNLEDTISINHNWFNGTNIISVVESLNLELR